jgi:ribosome assembly protein YihI (activator of Der GTPase)
MNIVIQDVSVTSIKKIPLIVTKKKKVQGGNNSENSQARILNLLTNDLSDNKKHIYEV